ncbi:metallophosphoesterase [Terasakiella sp. SH-1]|uniref:metallophosphoesterase n=1 Tax=Terasakiella sp. SH-1 TaxID=2560057 RepID=UPI001073AE76|nr:metallophosphoesterase [Terasakiella sp. SH-1]
MEIVRKPFPIPGTPDKDVCLVAIGDIHGRYDLLRKAIPCIRKSLPQDAKQVDLVLLGDILDRGDAAIEVIDYIREGIDDWNIIPILGNHEQLLLRVLNASDAAYRPTWRMWRGNGGLSTLENLQIEIPPIADISAASHKKALIQALRQERIDYIQNFYPFYRSGSILCVHAGVDPQKTLEENFSSDRLSQHPRHWAWIRDGFLDHDGPFPEGVFVVHGHTVIPGPKLEPHRIGLDTGACLHGVLSGAIFFNHEMTIFQVTSD